MRPTACCALFASLFSTSVVAADPPKTDVKNKDDVTRVACVGDSITFGSGIADRDRDSYPAVLGKLLGDSYDVRNFGVSGATLQKRGDKPYWTLDAFKDVSAFNPHIVIIKLGTNDTKPQNWHDVKDFQIDLQAMVNSFSELPEKPQIFLCTPVPVHKDAFGIREEVVRDEVVPTVKEVANRMEVPMIDLYAALKDDSVMFPDGVHPNAAGAKRIAETVAAAIKKSVDKGKTRKAE
jgi:lysophospholipase L1-like esterase